MSTPFAVGDRVRLVTALPYVKTADTMPMLRPGDLLTVDNVGIIREQKPGNTWAVKFDQGSFLIDSAHLVKLSDEDSASAAKDAASEG
ncbi:MAG: DUF3148 domain-containing protein [Cyanobacteria bacterium P01_D01_bin.71]